MLVDGLKKLLTTHFFQVREKSIKQNLSWKQQTKQKNPQNKTHPSKKFIVYKATKTSIEELCTCEVHYIL